MSLTDDITDPRLAKALAHPMRLEILRHLGDRTASPSEIAEGIGAPLTNVSYHVRKLRTLGLIKLVRKTPKRGVIEHYYSANPRPSVSDEAWGAMPDIVKQALSTASIKRVVAELTHAAASGGFNRRTSQFVRLESKLDERGWEEMSKLVGKFIADLEKVEQGASARIDAGKTEEIKTGLVLTMYERTAVPPGAKPAASPARKRSKASA